jgi:hypothetical protein
VNILRTVRDFPPKEKQSGMTVETPHEHPDGHGHHIEGTVVPPPGAEDQDAVLETFDGGRRDC